MAKEKDKVAELIAQAGSKKRTQMLGDIFSRFYERAGGAEAFADLLWEEFSKATVGSLVRQRILDLILKTTKALDDQAQAAATDDDLSDEDLNREFKQILEQQGFTIGTQTTAAGTATTAAGSPTSGPAQPAATAAAAVAPCTQPPP